MIGRSALGAAVLLAFVLATPLRAETVKLGVATPDVGMLPVYLAEAQGFFKEEGLDLQIVTFQGGPVAAIAMSAGAVDVNYAGIFDVLSSYMAGRDLVAFWSTSNAPIYNWYAPAKYKSLAELKGGKVGVSAVGSMSYYLSAWALSRSGLDAQHDVTFISLGDPMSRVAALKVGQVDLIPATPPGTLQLEAQGYKPLLSLGDLMPEFVDEMLYARRTTLDRNPEMLKKLIRALVHANHWGAQNRDAATKILMKNLGAKDDETTLYRKALDEKLPYLPDDGHFPESSIEIVLGFYHDSGKLKSIPPHSAFIDYRLIDYFRQHPIR